MIGAAIMIAAAPLLSTFVAGTRAEPQVQSAYVEEPQNPAVHPDILNFLIQDICVDAADRPVAGDPATCARPRNLRIGEPLPYLLTEVDRPTGRRLTSWSSIPVRGADGHRKILVLKNFQGGYFSGSQLSFSPARDAFDLIDVDHSPYASIVRTYDGGCQDQVFSRNGRSRSMDDRAGGWILFPTRTDPARWPPSSSGQVTTWRAQISRARPQCADNHASGITFWARPQLLTFESGKRLAAIRSDHFAAADLRQQQNSFERFYFTREYGMARWEAWRTLAACRAELGSRSPRCNAATGDPETTRRCSLLRLPTQKAAVVEQWGGQTWVRLDCRDQTHTILLTQPQLPLSPEIARGGGLIDIDYQASVRP